MIPVKTLLTAINDEGHRFFVTQVTDYSSSAGELWSTNKAKVAAPLKF
jgi:hypothetical protein